MTRRVYIRDEIEKHLSGKLATICIAPIRGDMIRYLYTRLDEDTTQEAVGSHLEQDMIKKNPDNISRMCVEVIAL